MQARLLDTISAREISVLPPRHLNSTAIAEVNQILFDKKSINLEKTVQRLVKQRSISPPVELFLLAESCINFSQLLGANIAKNIALNNKKFLDSNGKFDIGAFYVAPDAFQLLIEDGSKMGIKRIRDSIKNELSKSDLEISSKFILKCSMIKLSVLEGAYSDALSQDLCEFVTEESIRLIFKYKFENFDSNINTGQINGSVYGPTGNELGTLELIRFAAIQACFFRGLALEMTGRVIEALVPYSELTDLFRKNHYETSMATATGVDLATSCSASVSNQNISNEVSYDKSLKFGSILRSSGLSFYVSSSMFRYGILCRQMIPKVNELRVALAKNPLYLVRANSSIKNPLSAENKVHSESLVSESPSITSLAENSPVIFDKSLNHDINAAEIGTERKLRIRLMYDCAIALRLYSTYKTTSNQPKIQDEWRLQQICMRTYTEALESRFRRCNYRNVFDPETFSLARKQQRLFTSNLANDSAAFSCPESVVEDILLSSLIGEALSPDITETKSNMQLLKFGDQSINQILSRFSRAGYASGAVSLVLNRFNTSSANSTTYGNLLLAHAAVGSTSEAYRIGQIYLSLKGTDKSVLAVHAKTCLMISGKTKEALELSKKISRVIGHSLEAICLMANGRPREASTLLESNADDSNEMFLLALAYSLYRDLDRAEELVKQSLLLDTDQPCAWLLFALIRSARGDYDSCLAVCNSYSESSIFADFPIELLKIVTYTAMGLYQEALNDCVSLYNNLLDQSLSSRGLMCNSNPVFKCASSVVLSNGPSAVDTFTNSNQNFGLDLYISNKESLETPKPKDHQPILKTNFFNSNTVESDPISTTAPNAQSTSTTGYTISANAYRECFPEPSSRTILRQLAIMDRCSKSKTLDSRVESGTKPSDAQDPLFPESMILSSDILRHKVFESLLEPTQSDSTRFLASQKLLLLMANIHLESSKVSESKGMRDLRLREAENVTREALSRIEVDAAAFALRGSIACYRGDWDLARDSFYAGLQLESRQIDCLVGLAEVTLRTCGFLDEKIIENTHSNECDEAIPDDCAHGLYSALLFCRRVLEIDPNHTDSLRLVAFINQQISRLSTSEDTTSNIRGHLHDECKMITKDLFEEFNILPNIKCKESQDHNTLNLTELFRKVLLYDSTDPLMPFSTVLELYIRSGSI